MEGVEIKHVGWKVALIAAFLALTVSGCGGRGESDGSGSAEQRRAEAEKSRVLERDKALAVAFNASNAAEARAWLKDANHVIFEGSKEEVTKLVEDMYAAGAKEVRITGVVDIEGAQLSASLAVALPEDPAARMRVFDVERALYKAWEDEEAATQDVGQKYMDFAFD